MLKEKVDDKERNNEFDVTIRQQKFGDLEREVKEKGDLIEILKKDT